MNEQAQFEKEDRRHFEAALELRHAIYCNAEDEAFIAGEPRGRRSITYLMDANVVRKFMNPWGEARDLIPFADAASLQDDQAVAAAVIAVEFLFSRKLPGQHGHPALIAAGHADELAGFVNRLHELQQQQGTQARSRGEPTLQPLKERLAEWAEASEPQSPTDSLSDVDRDLRETFASTILDSLFGDAWQLTWLLRQDRLRSLRTHPDASSSLLSTVGEEDLVAALARDIANQRRDHSREHGKERETGHNSPSSSGSRALSPENIPRLASTNPTRNRNDATAIVQTILLNRNARNRDHCRYVLVSGDGAVHRAYARWFWSGSRDAHPSECYILRSPIQYIAILNQSALSSQFSRRRPTLLREVQFALDMLLRPVSRTERAYPEKLSLIAAAEFNYRTGIGEPFPSAIPSVWRASPSRYDTDAMRDVRDAFREANTECLRQDQGVLLPLLKRRFRSEADAVSEGLKRWAADPDGSVRRYQQELILKVEAAHLSIGVDSTLLDFWQSAAGPTERAPMTLRVDFSDIAGGPVEGDGLRDFVSDRERWRRAVDRLKQPGNPKATLFAAYVALRCARWPAARLYAERALRFLDHDPEGKLRSEIAHCVAISRRFDMASRQDFDEIEELLGQEIAGHASRGDDFGVARAESERFVLRLTLAFHLATAPEGDFHGPVPDLTFDVGTALRQLDSLQNMPEYCPGGRWYGPVNRIELQIAVTVIDLEILRGIFNGEAPKADPAILQRCEAIVARGVESGDFPQVLNADLLAFRWLTEPDPQRRQQHAVDLARVCDDLLGRDNSVEPTPMDRNALKRFKAAIHPEE
jgi:hypothetical protein